MKISIILLILVLCNSCMVDGMNLTDPKSCLNTMDPELLAPNGYIDMDYNEKHNLPLMSLGPKYASNFRVLSINVGTSIHGEDDGLGMPAYNIRLTYSSYEKKIAKRIQALRPRPNLIALQEVLTERQCSKLSLASRLNHPDKTCWFRDSEQVQRLVGPHYAIVCDGNQGVDCLAVLKSWASIDSLVGDFAPSWKIGTAPLPPQGFEVEFGLCDYTKNECSLRADLCDIESSVAHALLTVNKTGKKFNAVFLHPTALGESCVQAQLLQAFELATQYHKTQTIILGDWNYDNTRFIGTHSSGVIMQEFVGPGRTFRLHNNVDESCKFTKTGPYGLTTLDHVVSNFAHGLCRVYTPDMSQRYYSPLQDFDHGVMQEIFPNGNIPESYELRRMDHKAILCDLYSKA